MVRLILFLFLVVYRSIFKVVLSIFRTLFCNESFYPVPFLAHHFNCPVITPSDYTGKIQENPLHMGVIKIKTTQILKKNEYALQGFFPSLRGPAGFELTYRDSRNMIHFSFFTMQLFTLSLKITIPKHNIKNEKVFS